MIDLAACAFSTGHLADPIADVGGELALSIYAAPSHLRTAIALRATRKGLWIHVDVMRDSEGRDLGVNLATLEELTGSRQNRVDVHLIGDGGVAAFDEVCALGCTRITLPLECCPDVLSMAATVRGTGAQLWIAIPPLTAVEDLFPLVSVVDGVLVMLLQAGKNDPADLSLLTKAQILADHLPVGVDGSVDTANVIDCLDAGARYIVSGRGLLYPTVRLNALPPTHSKGKR